jgi:hypothetical protein
LSPLQRILSCIERGARLANFLQLQDCLDFLRAFGRLDQNETEDLTGESGATRTPIPAQGGQQSGDCGQQVIAA